MMRVVIFGTGAMACLFGARLARVAEVTLVGTWEDAIDAINERGILIEDSGEIQSIPVRAAFVSAAPVPADLALVLVKSWQTGAVASRLSEFLAPEGLAVSLQNGLGNVEALGDRAFPGSTSEGATLVAPGHVRTGGLGKTCAVAPERVIALLRQAGFESCRCSVEEAEGLLWGKLCVSCGINALTAILRIPNGGLLERSDAADLMIRAANECAAVARAKGIRLPFDDAGGQVQDVARRTARNRSSMYQDILRGAPTECDAIYGAVVREAGLVGVEVPVNSVLRQLVRVLAGRE